MKYALSFLLLTMLVQPAQLITNKTESFRIIPIPKREHGYNNFTSIAITSHVDFDSFLRRTSAQTGWNNRKEFADALREAKVDFTKEALVLLRHSESSGSVQVTFETPVLQEKTLICKIHGKAFRTGFGGTADMAYYCFAVVVCTLAVNQVELQAVEGGFQERTLAPITFPIGAN
jgi:hypothetical protein